MRHRAVTVSFMVIIIIERCSSPPGCGFNGPPPLLLRSILGQADTRLLIQLMPRVIIM